MSLFPPSRQLTLDLTTPPAHARADFLPAPANHAALKALDRPQDWPAGRMLLIGPEGSGKTHLAAFWAAENGARRISASALRPDAADLLAADGGAVVVEDADHAGFAAGAEQALFHLWNLCGPRDCLLLLTARTPPRDWGLVLPDLRSRMDAMPQVRLMPPDESLLAAVLAQYGLGVSAHSAAGLSGCAPCRLRCHGHSASIPHAFAPARLRRCASLASRGKRCRLSPPRDAWCSSMPPNRLRRIGQTTAVAVEPVSR